MTANKPAYADLRFEDHPDLKLSLEAVDAEATVIVRLAGIIDTYNSDYFRNQALRLIEAGARCLIFDASATTFMSSTGIGAFTALLKMLQSNQGSMIIFGMPQRIFEVFQLLGFSSFFQFCNSREEALSMLGTENMESSIFPVSFSCPVCHRKLKTVKAGKFRCSSCKVILAVNQDGEVRLG